MKFKTFEVENFRAISKVKLTDLEDVVLIAGSNGSGKSCIFDAIRLFKSMYGEYHHNELNSWFNEFQIGVNRNNYQVLGSSLLPDFQDVEKTMRFYGELILSREELHWLNENLDTIIKNYLWTRKNPRHPMESISISEQARFFQQINRDIFSKAKEEMLDELKKEVIVGEIRIDYNKDIMISTSPTLEKIFSIYKPDSIGIIDYHGPQRNYNRENMNQINLNIETRQQNLSQHALYNTVNKYNHVKTELASSYIRNLLSQEAGENDELGTDLNKTLEELFTTFFPDKKFLGPQPTKDGKLTFNIKTSYGAIHDIDGLSSGEKEILYGYLRIRNSAPKNSVLLIDEPELHLNPKLTQGLPIFYQQHLGKSLNNQIWLVTHSDTLLRQAIGHKGFSVFHLQKTESGITENQVKEITASDEIEKAVIDLVGDLAAYRPGAKLVIVEGGGGSEFDVQMIKRLFPDFESKVNLESGGSKRNINHLHELLEKAEKSGSISTKFYSIVDKDFETDIEISGKTIANKFYWDRFHIENYLLENKYILKTVKDLDAKNFQNSVEPDIENLLIECARKTVNSLVRGLMEHEVNQKLVHCIKTKIERTSNDISGKLIGSIESSFKSLTKIIENELTTEKLKNQENKLIKKYEKDLTNDQWKKSFRGRDILNEFTGAYLKGINYENFRNLIIAKMRDDGFQPKGMKDVLDKILNSE